MIGGGKPQTALLRLPANAPDMKNCVSGLIQRLIFLLYFLNIALMSTGQAGQECLTEGRPSFLIARINVRIYWPYLEPEGKS